MVVRWVIPPNNLFFNSKEKDDDMTWDEIKAAIDQKFVDGGFNPSKDEVLYIDFSGEPTDIIATETGCLIIE